MCFIEKKLCTTCFNFFTKTEIALVANLSSAEAEICPCYTILMPANSLQLFTEVEVNSTWLITSELANQRALFTCARTIHLCGTY